MPEGPEIRIAADRVARVLLGNKIVAAEFGLTSLQRFSARIAGSTVTAVETRGKAMLTRFDNGLTLYSHNQLYGRWYTVKRPRKPSTQRQLRVALHTETHSALLYSASDIQVLTERELAAHPFLLRAGPDILDAALTPGQVEERLRSPAFRNRSLGALYLDQSFLAGNGNYLRSEILWAAGIAPRRRPSDLTDRELRNLAGATLKIARRSYRTRGVTVAPAEAKKRKDAGLPYEQYRFQVYGREGLACHRCGSTIERDTIGSRGIFLCGICQPY